MNYFELFSIPVSFIVDHPLLSATYRELQQQYHPDNYALESDGERLAAMQKSTEINDAYQTLKDNCLRAEYLLVLAGYNIELQKTIQDTAFLMQQMQWREALEGFSEDDEDALEEFAGEIQKQADALLEKIAEQLDSKDYAATAESIRRLKFMLKLQSEIELLEEKLFD